jgi:hypothetical protein
VRPEIIPRSVGSARGERFPWWSGSTWTSRASSAGNATERASASSRALSDAIERFPTT